MTWLLRKVCLRHSAETNAGSSNILIGELCTLCLVTKTKKKPSRNLTQSQGLPKLRQSSGGTVHGTGKQQLQVQAKYPRILPINYGVSDQTRELISNLLRSWTYNCQLRADRSNSNEKILLSEHEVEISRP